jgi:hypothetical protein
MALSITYFAPTTSMGDTSEDDAAAFRSWAQAQLLAEWPDAAITVSEGDASRQTAINGAESSEQEDDIIDFVGRLWDNFPWC